MIKKKYPYFSNVAFAYFDDIYIPEKLKRLLDALQQSYNKMLQDDEMFAVAIRYELFNHEAGYTYSFTEALHAMGLLYRSLSDRRKAIVKRELDYVIERTNA